MTKQINTALLMIASPEAFIHNLTLETSPASGPQTTAPSSHWTAAAPISENSSENFRDSEPYIGHKDEPTKACRHISNSSFPQQLPGYASS